VIPLRDDNPSRTTPFVTYTLIALCVLAFLWQLSLGREGFQLIGYSLGVVPAVLVSGATLPPDLDLVSPWMTIFTSMFMHGGWLHLLGNMLYLYIFGDNVEDSMGHVRFAIFYLLCGVGAVFAQVLPEPASQIPMVGASGAISGVLGAYLLLHPHARVLTLIFTGLITTIRLPAIALLLIWFGLQLVQSIMTAPGQGGVAFRAHIGGFVAGAALIALFKHRDVRLWNRSF
jgi:membrane associated rhomboid family serine protease